MKCVDSFNDERCSIQIQHRDWTPRKPNIFHENRMKCTVFLQKQILDDLYQLWYQIASNRYENEWWQMS